LKILKKYPNRRIYDTSASEYIKLGDIRQMVINYEQFQVVDSKTGDDLTRATLMQVVTELESEGQRSLLTNRILEELIRFYGDQFASVIGPLIEQQILAFLEEQDKIRAHLKQFASPNIPSGEELLKKYIESLPKFGG
jgi:polyhydroxyalkanoate synthesis repressor PhaR